VLLSDVDAGLFRAGTVRPTRQRGVAVTNVTVRELLEGAAFVLFAAWVAPGALNEIRRWCAVPSYWRRVRELAGPVAGIVLGVWLLRRFGLG